MTTRHERIAKRVDRGARYLDRTAPGWEDKVINPIDLTSPTGCVIGQVHGNFFEHLKKKFHFNPLNQFGQFYYMGFVGWWSRAHGFDALSLSALPYNRACWELEIRSRREARLIAELQTWIAEARCQSAAQRIREFEQNYHYNKERVAA